MHRWHAHGGGSEETPQVRPRCTDGKDGHNKKKKKKKKGILDGASAPTGSSSAGCAVGGTVHFNALADGLEWMAREHRVEHCITCGTENPDECRLNLQRLLDLCNHLGYQYHRRRWRGRPVFWAYSLTQSKVNFGSRGVSW